jgi:hypothetical protein
MDSLKHEQSTTQVAVTLLGNSLFETLTACVTLLLSDLSQDCADLVFGRCSDSDKQGTTSNRSNDIARTVGQKDQAQVGTVFLHCSSQGSLGVSGEMVCLIDDDNLEALFGGHVDLLCLSNLLEKVLDNNTVVVANITRCYLEMVVGRDDVELELAVARCLEDSTVDLDLLYTWAVKCAKGCCDSCLFARSGGSIDQKMWEVSTLRLQKCQFHFAITSEMELLTNDLRRSDRSW